MPSWGNIKSYFWYIFGIMGVVFFWVGVWDGLGNLYLLENPVISLVAGLVMLSLSKFIFREADPIWGGKVKKPIHKVIETVKKHPLRHEIAIKYKDTTRNKEMVTTADKIEKTEKNFLILIDQDREVFIPLHRLTEISHKGKKHWTPQIEHGKTSA